MDGKSTCMRFVYELEDVVGRWWDVVVVPLQCICKEEQECDREKQKRHGEEEEE